MSTLPGTYLRRFKNQNGAILMMVLVSVTLLGLMAGLAGSSWQTYKQKSKEADLLWKGDQMRRAIGRYYEFQGGGAKETGSTKTNQKKSFPQSLKDLLKDPRALETTRHLRRMYLDPMTGEEWELIPAPQGGGIMGVRSTATLKPFKQYGFSEEHKNFTAQREYRAWNFIYIPAKKKADQAAEPQPESD